MQAQDNSPRRTQHHAGTCCAFSAGGRQHASGRAHGQPHHINHPIERPEAIATLSSSASHTARHSQLRQADLGGIRDAAVRCSGRRCPKGLAEARVAVARHCCRRRIVWLVLITLNLSPTGNAKDQRTARGKPRVAPTIRLQEQGGDGRAVPTPTLRLRGATGAA